MKVDLALEKGVTKSSYYIVINDRFYIKTTKEVFENLAKELKLNSVKLGKCKYFREVDYGYRQSKQCYAQKFAPEVNCDGCKCRCDIKE